MSNRTNPFNKGDFVRIVIEGAVTKSSDHWDDGTGYLIVDVPHDNIYVEKDQVVSVEKIEPPFRFPETAEAVISGVKRSNGSKQYFHRNGDRWMVLGTDVRPLIWDDNGIAQEYESLKTEWSGV